jgi:hypothetical protein
LPSSSQVSSGGLSRCRASVRSRVGVGLLPGTLQEPAAAYPLPAEDCRAFDGSPEVQALSSVPSGIPISHHLFGLRRRRSQQESGGLDRNPEQDRQHIDRRASLSARLHALLDRARLLVRCLATGVGVPPMDTTADRTSAISGRRTFAL